MNEQDIIISPNPTNDYVEIYFKNTDEIHQLIISSQSGQILRKYNVEKYIQKIRLI